MKVRDPHRFTFETPYFDGLIDDFSIWQFADGKIPLREHGYALDDATRGLLACLALDKRSCAKVLFDYIVRSRKGDEFYGFADGHRHFIQSPASEDAKGQVVWAFAYAANLGFERRTATRLVQDLIPSLLAMRSIRGCAYTLLGAIYADETLATIMEQHLCGSFRNATEDWFWPEGQLTYGNAIVPYALLRYALMRTAPEVGALARKALVFLDRCCTTEDGLRSPIGYDGWFSKGDPKPSVNGQQPIDVAYMIWAWICAYQLSGDMADFNKATLWMRWFEGDNISKTRMYDPHTLMTYDGINKQPGLEHHDRNGVNVHSGAESNICFLLSRWMVHTKQTV